MKTKRQIENELERLTVSLRVYPEHGPERGTFDHYQWKQLTSRIDALKWALAPRPPKPERYNVLTGLVHSYCKPYRTNTYWKAVVALIYRRMKFGRGYIITTE